MPDGVDKVQRRPGTVPQLYESHLKSGHASGSSRGERRPLAASFDVSSKARRTLHNWRARWRRGTLILMRRFKWIEWNLQKIAAHGLSAEEVEAAFERVYQLDERRDGSFRMFAEVPSGRRIWVIWRYDREDEQVPDVLEKSTSRRSSSSPPTD